MDNALDSDDVVYPRCTACDAPLVPVRTERTGPGSQRRTFICNECGLEAIQDAHFSLLVYERA